MFGDAVYAGVSMVVVIFVTNNPTAQVDARLASSLAHYEQCPQRTTTDGGVSETGQGGLSSPALVWMVYPPGNEVFPHGQQITNEPKALLRKAGFRVVEPPEGHLCCGSAGTYNMLQQAIATRLRKRDLRHSAQPRPDLTGPRHHRCIPPFRADCPTL